MFSSHVTRPLRWAIPVAVLGGIVALLWFVRPLEVSIAGEVIDCREPGFSDVIGQCGDLRTSRFVISGLILLAGAVPLIVVAVRACVWAADTLAALREDVRRLTERLDGQS